MPRSNPSIRTFLAALTLSAGVATPLALADEPAKDDPALSDPDAQQQESSSDEQAKGAERDNADYVEVRVSLPDGRTFTRLEPKRNLSARYTRPGSAPSGVSSSPRSGSSRVSVASRSVTGGSNSSSVRSGGGSGGGGGSSASAGGGGGGGGASSGAKSSGSAGSSSSATKGVFTFGSNDTSTGAESATGSGSSGAGVATYGSGSSASGSAQGSSDSTSSASTGSGSSSTGGSGTSSSSGSSSSGSSSSSSSSGGGVYTYGGGSTSSAGSSGGSSGSSSSGSSSGSSGSSQGSGSSTPSVPSIGEPTYDREGNATGGQRVEFNDAGMSAAVIGSRVYFNNVELVVADQDFEVVTGMRLEHNSAIMEESRLASGDTASLGSFNTRSSTIKLEFEPDTIVTLMLYSPSQSVMDPSREVRTWTVRIR